MVKARPAYYTSHCLTLHCFAFSFHQKVKNDNNLLPNKKISKKKKIKTNKQNQQQKQNKANKKPKHKT